ncbi:LysR family transcriptional regulator [Sneathiella chinensis]|uniref:LysR family transcriptional regulator n=3 Tax=Alphaproteobacteria TaxID=28211 RepID=A0ABQ5TZU7_9PROT|nr:LysR family transcriptional regulator [Sneathiella chinensis]GLQ05093.1 LysR family transcriptional regulator [Sneathiella chinensis]
MQWEGVVEFVAVAELQSFTAAAKRLGISTAQVSRQVSALEARLSTRLFHRTTRRVTATEAGQLYYQHCRQVLDSLEEAERLITDLQQTPKGTIKLTAPITYGERTLAPLLNNFLLHYPDVTLDLHLSNRVVDIVAEGFDLAIRLGTLEQSRLMAKRLSTRIQYVCASPAYLSRCGTPHSLTELDHHNCLRGNQDYWRFQENGKARTVRITGTLRSSSGRALVDAALKGIGIIQLPDYYVQSALDAGRLIALLDHYQPVNEGIWALYPHNRHLSPKIRHLLDYLGKALKPAPS